MGAFASARWIVGLFLYFFAFFVIMYAVVGAAGEYGFDTHGDLSYLDNGFSNDNNQPYAQGGKCSGSPVFTCEGMDIRDMESCILFVPYNCKWQNETLVYNSTIFDRCYGFLNAACKDFTNPRMCGVAKCTWTDYTNNGTASMPSGYGSAFDWETTKNTVVTMLGFRATIGIPYGWTFVFSTVFFYLPFIMLVLALYFGLPFLHS